MMAQQVWGSGYDHGVQRYHGQARRVAQEARAGYILVIDDSPAILSLLTTLLGEIEGYDVRTATSMREAQRRAPVEAPALILLDLRLPNESTAESVRRLRRRDDWAESPLVISSGHQQIAAFARDLRADGYLPKPFDLDAVSALARRYALPRGAGVPARCAPLQRDESLARAIPVELLAAGTDDWDDTVSSGM